MGQPVDVDARIPEDHRPGWQPSLDLPSTFIANVPAVTIEGPQSTDSGSASSQAHFFNYGDGSLSMSFVPEDPGIALDPSVSAFDMNEKGTSIFDVDFGGLDWSLLNSFSFDYTEDLRQHHTLRGDPETGPSDSVGTARSMDSTESTATIIERFWYTKLDFTDTTRMNQPDNDRSSRLSPVSEMQFEVKSMRATVKTSQTDSDRNRRISHFHQLIFWWVDQYN